MVTAEQIIEMLGLKRHPTCGFVAETYRSRQQVPLQALPASYEGSRPFGSVLYFLVTPEAQIRLHRVRSDQMYHHYLGEPLEVLLLYPDGTGEIKVVGSDLAAGMRPPIIHPRRHVPYLSSARRKQLRAARNYGVARFRALRSRTGRSQQADGGLSCPPRRNQRFYAAIRRIGPIKSGVAICISSKRDGPAPSSPPPSTRLSHSGCRKYDTDDKRKRHDTCRYFVSGNHFRGCLFHDDHSHSHRNVRQQRKQRDIQR